MGSAVNTAVQNINTSAVLKTGGNAIADLTGLATGLQDSNGNNLGIAVGDKINVSYVVNGTTVSTDITVDATTDLADITDAVTHGTTAVGTGADAGKLVTTATTGGTTTAINGLSITVKDASGNVRNAATNAFIKLR